MPDDTKEEKEKKVAWVLRDMPEDIYDFLTDEQARLKKAKRRVVSQGDTVYSLLRSAYPDKIKKKDVAPTETL